MEGGSGLNLWEDTARPFGLRSARPNSGPQRPAIQIQRMTTLETSHILLVEDDDDHAEIVARGLADDTGEHLLHRVPDGESALDYLFRRGEYADPERSPKPNLVLLDLRLPRMDGAEVLKVIKESRELRHIPVVVLSTSAADRDLTNAYAYHANSYLVKPGDFATLARLMKSLRCYWLTWNQNPSTEGAKWEGAQSGRAK